VKALYNLPWWRGVFDNHKGILNGVCECEDELCTDEDDCKVVMKLLIDGEEKIP